MIIANRTKEVELFQKIVQGSFAKRVLLVKAESGFGKTWLLARFKHTLPTNTLCVQVDLKSAERGIPYIFYLVPDDLGQQHFPTLNAAVKQYLSSGVEVSDTKMIGTRNILSVFLSSEDKVARDLRFDTLQKAFFQDLSKIPRKIVFLFDTYEKAPTELANWLEGEFLRQVAKIQNLIVVIAGQETPKPTIEWMALHHCFPLKAILDKEAWCEYTQKAGLSFNQDEIKVAIDYFDGKPAEIVKMLETLARKRQ